MTTEKTKIKTPLFKRILRIFLIIIASILVLLVVIILLVQTSAVQNFIKDKAISWLQSKIHSKVSLGRIDIGFPKSIVLKDIYIEDQKKDTLLSAGNLSIELGMWRLFHGQVSITEIQMKSVTIHIKRVLPDTLFNFQYIINAFAPAPAGEKKTLSESKTEKDPLSIEHIGLDQIRFQYDDAVTGNALKLSLSHLDMAINRMDTKNLYFGIPLVHVSGLHGTIHQFQPLVAAPNEDTSQSSIQLAVKKIALDDIQLAYANDVSAVYGQLGLGTLLVKARQTDLQKKIFQLDELDLSKTTVSLRIGKNSRVKMGSSAKINPSNRDSSSWHIGVSRLELDSNNIAFDDDNQALQRRGMDFSHLHATALSIKANHLRYGPESISAEITMGAFREKSGFTLQTLKGNALYSNKQAFVHGLELKTLGSYLLGSLSLRYPSLAAIVKSPGAMDLDIDIRHSSLLTNDLLNFVPSLSATPPFMNAGAAFSVTAKMKGKLADLQIDQLQLEGLKNTRIDIHGHIKGLPAWKTLGGNLIIRNISSSKEDLFSLVDQKLFPAGFSIPEKWNLSGTLKGSLANMAAALVLNSSEGNLRVKGGFQNLNETKELAYDGSFSAEALNLGAIMNDSSWWGKTSFEINAVGKGFDPKNAHAQINGVIDSIGFKQYEYKNIHFKARIDQKQVSADLVFHDPNLDLSLVGTADLSSTYPAVKLKMTVDSIRTGPLHFTKDHLVYHGIIDADFPQTDPDQLQGALVIEQSVLVREGRKIAMDTIRLSAGKHDSAQFLNLYADFFHAGLEGRYKLTEMGSVFRQIFQPYFATGRKEKEVKTAAYHFVLSGALINKPILKTLFPDLERLDPVSFTGTFDSGKGWNADVRVPEINYADTRIKNFQLHAKPDGPSLSVVTSIQEFSSGKSFSFFNTTLDTRVADDKIDFALNIQDKSSKDKYHIGGIVQENENQGFLFSLHPEKLLLNYQHWTIAQDNQIQYSSAHIGATDFDLKKGQEALNINSLTSEKDAPLQFEFTQFLLSTITAFAGSDSSLANGELNGKLILDHQVTKTSFTSDLNIRNLSVYGDTVGNIALKVNHTQENTFSASLLLSGRGNDLELKGDYTAEAGDSRLNLEGNLRKLQLETIQGFSFGALKNASGSVNGKFSVQGVMSDPKINGNLSFDQAVLVPRSLNTRFSIDKESLQINNNSVHFSQFSILDSSKNRLVLDGDIKTADFKLYDFALSLSAKHFQALSSTKKDNKLYYGRFFFSADLAIKGTNLLPSVDGSIRVDKNTKITVVIPQDEPGVEDRAGIVQFVDMKSPGQDSILSSSYDSIGKSPLKGFDISTNIEIDSSAEIGLLIDQTNGDNLVAKGSASLTGSVDRSGKTSLTGTYQLSNGSYDLSFSLLHRRFLIQQGSTITWTGEPSKAKLNIDAIYLANAPPIDLVQDQIAGSAASVQNTYQQKLPFEVHLKMTGDLLKPDIAFDIVLPDDKAYNVSKDLVTTVQTKLDILRQEPGEINKQVFALLILGRFVADDPFSTASNGANAESIARASVSKLLSQQLNQIASNLVHGVDLNFDLQSTDDYTTGQLQNRTDLNASVSKRLLNDRLTVTVGSDFELEGPQNINANTQSNNLAGNIALGYKLSKDGRYLIRVYRKNDYDDVVEGYVVETGIGFIITIDYDHFREIFESKKKKALAQAPNQ